MIASERVLYIMKSINELGVVNLKDIASQLGISETTVRRDFEKLEKQGKLKRVQGGATSHGGTEELLDNAQLSTHLKTNVHVQEKQAVGTYAASLVKDGECIYLDDGTSILPLAEILIRKKVHIVTNSTLILEKARKGVADVFLIGGLYQPHYDLVVGPMSLDNLSKFHLDHAFMGCFSASLEKQAAYTLEMDCVSIKMKAIEIAEKRHLLLDDSKLTKTGFYAIADFKTFDTIICNKAESLPERLPDNFVLV